MKMDRLLLLAIPLLFLSGSFVNAGPVGDFFKKVGQSIVLVITFGGSLVLANENDPVITAARKYVAAHSTVSEFDVSVEKIEGDYARVKVTPKHAGETDPAWVFLKREKGVWRGLTIGTFFTTEDYAEFHIPPSIQL